MIQIVSPDQMKSEDRKDCELCCDDGDTIKAQFERDETTGDLRVCLSSSDPNAGFGESEAPLNKKLVLKLMDGSNGLYPGHFNSKGIFHGGQT